eukprot:TRINITY_DN102433_c0_g1_i1.p1 TRINITY_DN102433_c0_g1~~TRINITY_DN102433_c0_g1_i1.p1  ORF type:complete len:310 (+),score=63.00 TRINITY_DN102433_c0_g1_i1:41-931(+)
MSTSAPPTAHAVQRPRPRRNKAESSKSAEDIKSGLKLTADYQTGAGCEDEDCEGCELLLGGGKGLDDDTADEASVVDDVLKARAPMSAWERIAAVHSWNQIGAQELKKQKLQQANNAYIRGLVFADALGSHGDLVTSCASWAPGIRQQQEVQRLCCEAYIGLALLQLRREKIEESDEEKATFLEKSMEASRRALELNETHREAHMYLGIANLRLAKRFKAAGNDLRLSGYRAVRAVKELQAEESDPNEGFTESEEYQEMSLYLDELAVEEQAEQNRYSMSNCMAGVWNSLWTITLK